MSEAQLGSKEGNKGVLGQARQVELLELTHGEGVAIARQIFAELHLQDEGSGVGSECKESAAQELAEIIADKQQAHLPLFVVMAAAQVALFERSHLRHRQVNSYAQVPRAGSKVSKVKASWFLCFANILGHLLWRICTRGCRRVCAPPSGRPVASLDTLHTPQARVPR